MKVLRSRIFRILFCLILGGGGFPPEGYAEVLPDIDRIDLLGVSVFQSQMIEGALEVSAGYPLERQKVLKTEENLQSLYFLHGYENVRINSRLMRKKGEKGVETVLEFDVSEGKPVRVTDIQVELKGSRSSSSAQSLGLLVEKIKADIGIVPGDVFNQEKINDAKRTIQETLASDEYVGAKVESVYSVEDSASTALTGKFKDAARWVKVNLTVDLGDKVIFGYRGNKIGRASCRERVSSPV